jgi:ankyrin repeat protein
MRTKIRPLGAICCERNPDPARQRAEITAAIKAGADVHETDKNGVTPLHYAVRFRSPAAVESLLRHGASVNQSCRRSGSTPLHRAVTSTGAPGTRGKGAQAREIIAILLRHGADPSLKNKLGKRAIDYVKDEELRRVLSVRK